MIDRIVKWWKSRIRKIGGGFTFIRLYPNFGAGIRIGKWSRTWSRAHGVRKWHNL